MTVWHRRQRRLVNALMVALTACCALLALVPLALIFFHLVRQGLGALSIDFLTQLPQPAGAPGGGMANAIIGSGILLAVALAVGLPCGIGGGIYLAEFGRGPLAGIVRFCADLLSGTPSIVIGIFAYTLCVLPTRRFSALAGGVALGVIMIPTVLRSSEEMLKLVPRAVREGAIALGVPYWKVMLRVVLATARSGIITGILLAIARIAGETAPLLFTSLGNQFWSFSLLEPIAALPLQIFVYAISPFETWQAQAWAGALLLILVVLCLNVLARVVSRRQGAAT